MTHPPDPAALRDAVAAIARDQLGWTRPLPDGDLAEALDSVDRLAFVVAIEDHFQIAFDPEDDAQVRTLDDVLAVIHRRLAERG